MKSTVFGVAPYLLHSVPPISFIASERKFHPLAVLLLPVESKERRRRVFAPKALRAPALSVNKLVATFTRRTRGCPWDGSAVLGRNKPAMPRLATQASTKGILSITMAGRQRPARYSHRAWRFCSGSLQENQKHRSEFAK
jgi:hypothetical protein